MRKKVEGNCCCFSRDLLLGCTTTSRHTLISMEVVIRTYIVSYTDVNHRVADANPVKDFGTSRHALLLLLLAATFLIDILLSEKERARENINITSLVCTRVGNLQCKCLHIEIPVEDYRQNQEQKRYHNGITFCVLGQNV